MSNKKSNNNNSGIYFEKGQNFIISKKSIVSVTNYGDKIIIKKSWKRPINLIKYKRIDKDNYINLSTGEICTYRRKSNYKTEKEIDKSMKQLKELISFNFKGNSNEIFLTLTCEDDMNINEIKKSIKYFIKRLKRIYPEKRFEYIYKFERMKNGKWHSHLLLKDSKNKVLYIKNNKIQKLWKKGITKTERIYESNKKSPINNDVNNLSNYMAKKTQLTSVPRGERLYGCSNGIKKPSKKYMIYENIIKEIEPEFNFCYENTILVKSKKTDKVINSYKTEVYNKKDYKN